MINFFKSSNISEEFIHENNELLFKRLKLVSKMLVFTYPCFFIVDFFLLNKLDHTAYKLMLTVIHMVGPVISLIFLLLDRSRIRLSKGLAINLYIFLYLLIGAGSTINSQLYTGNIYAYIIILFAVAVIFPIQPKNLFILYSSIHLLFVAGLYLAEPNSYTLLFKLINSTGTAVISFTISLAFYTLRRNDFFNRQKLRLQEESFRRLFNMNPHPLILTKLDSNEILLMNNQALEYFQLENAVITDGHFLFRNPAEREEIMNRLKEQQSVTNFVTEQQINPRLKKWALLNFELVDYLSSTCLLIGITDITDMKRKEAELLEHASIDVLTGARNRRSGLEIVRKQLQNGPDARDFILCYIDINNLKMVNDHFGHAAGDDLIKSCCDMISRQITNDDVLFRLGGDEFIVIFFSKQLGEVELIWDDIQSAFQVINDSRQKTFQLSASHGCCSFKPGMSITLEELLEQADQEMYKNKLKYKKCVKLPH